MLIIVTNTNNINTDNIVDDVEAYFEIVKRQIIKHPLFDKIIKELDNADRDTEKSQEDIMGKFGQTTIDNLSSGCKALLISVLEPNTYVNFLEAGRNVIDYAIKLCKDENIDLHIIYQRRFGASNFNAVVSIDGKCMTVYDAI